jgi:hypothetical protein
MTLSDDISEGVVREMVLEDPLVWWETCVKIEDKRKELISPIGNTLQQRLTDYVVYCRKHKLPIRAVILKPRQKGISTITVAICQWLQKVRARNLLIVGGLKWQADNLWSIYRRYQETDEFPWGFGGFVQDQTAQFGNGSQSAKQTAGGKAPGRSATIQLLICTEAAYWGQDESVKNAAGVLAALMASIPKGDDAEDTLVFLESTSAGGSGMFYRRYQDAMPLEEFMAGARSPDNFVRIFAGWHEFSDSYIKPSSPQEEHDLMRGIGAYNPEEARREREMIVRYNLNAGQIKYWRSLLSECDNDPDKRDREYPTTPEDAFRAAQPCRFNLAMLRQMRDEALNVQRSLWWGMLAKPDYSIERFVPEPIADHEDAEIIIHEWPEVGRRYIIPVDNAGGRATGDDKADTDCHAVPVMREGYFCAQKGRWVPPAVVASIKPQQRVDIDILAEWVWRLHVFYGRCMIVPEANNDRGLIMLLRNKGALIYEQERHATVKEMYKPSGKLGFWTSGGEGELTRRWIIEHMARAIRQLNSPGEGLFCPFLWILDELEHFVTDPDSGKAAAMADWHDDWVLAICIGLATMGSATTYQLPVLSGAALPRDLRDMAGSGVFQGGRQRGADQV